MATLLSTTILFFSVGGGEVSILSTMHRAWHCWGGYERERGAAMTSGVTKALRRALGGPFLFGVSGTSLDDRSYYVW